MKFIDIQNLAFYGEQGPYLHTSRKVKDVPPVSVGNGFLLRMQEVNGNGMYFKECTPTFPRQVPPPVMGKT